MKRRSGGQGWCWIKNKNTMIRKRRQRHVADFQNDPKNSQGGTDVFRTASAVAVTGMICVVTLGSQAVISIPEDELSMWTLFSVILLFLVLVYNLNCHYEAEKEIVRLKEQ